MNNITVSGIVDNQPELRQTNGGQPVLNFSVAVEERRRRERPMYLRVAVFGDFAETLREHLGKRARVLVNGRLQIRGYTNAQNEKKTSVEIVADSVEVLDEAPVQENRAVEVPDEDIPF